MDMPFDVHAEQYGSDNAQSGELYVPKGKPLAVVCLFHGGFWKMPYGREQMETVAQFLAAHRFLVWNSGYRRVGAMGGGFPGTFDDVVTSVKHLRVLARQHPQIDLDNVILVGHSAGGQLAFWYCQQAHHSGGNYLRPKAVVGLAPVLDLKRAHREGLGNNAVRGLLGCTPDEDPQRYKHYSPMESPPFAVKQLVVHGDKDTAVPASWSSDYVAAARARADDVEYLVLKDGGHMDFLDIESESFRALFAWLKKIGAA